MNTICSSVDVDKSHPVTVGTDNVFGPVVKIRAVSGPIVIGSGNVFECMVEVRNVLPPAADGSPQTMYIGDNNHFGTRTTVYAQEVGSNNILHTGASVLVGAKVGDGAILTARKSVACGEVLADNSTAQGHTVDIRPDYLPKLRAYLAGSLPDFHTCRPEL